MEPWTCHSNLMRSDALHFDSMPRGDKYGAARAGSLVCAGLLLLAGASHLPADQIELKSGDRYVGQVVSVDTNTVVLQSDVLGKIRLPRSKVAAITLGRASATNSPAPSSGTNAESQTLSGAAANTPLRGSYALKGMKVNTNTVQQVRKQFLDGAGDEANAKFDELYGGLLAGKLNVDDIRAQSKAAADQLRALQKQSGEDTGFAAEAYLSILDHFLKETAPSASTSNATKSSPRPKPKAEPEED